MKRLRYGLIAALLLFAPPTAARAQDTGLLHGFIRDSTSGEPVALATITTDEARIGTRADRNGYYVLEHLPSGSVRLRVRALGYAELDTTLVVRAGHGMRLDLFLRPQALAINGLVVEAAREGAFAEPDVSTEIITPAMIRRVPAALEPDLLRSLQALPGVTSPGLLSSRLLVRGGAGDQNLFLLNGFPVLYPYHLTGAFSAFPVAAIRNAQFWMGAPPARFGGRLSSVVDVKLKDGNRERTTGTASLGLLSSAAVVEGPHPAGAWMVGARRTYMDAPTLVGLPGLPYDFHDLYGSTYVKLGKNDRISALAYLSGDHSWRLGQRDEDHFDWGSHLLGLSWRHLLGGRVLLRQRVSASGFGETLRGGFSDVVETRIDTDHHVSLLALSGDAQIEPGYGHHVELGYVLHWQTDEHRTSYDRGLPGIEWARTAATKARLLAAYVEDDLPLGDALRVRLGIRGEKSGPFHSLQPRVSAKYLLSDHLALTGGFATVRQYDKILQDPDVALDLYSADIWATAYEAGQDVEESQHLIGGVEAKLPHRLRLRAEFYDKSFSGLLLAAPYDPTVRTPAIERLEQASGAARGVDLLLARDAISGLRGWVGYTLAWTERTVGEETFAAAPFPHQRLVAIAETEVGEKWSVSARFDAQEGIPFTPATASVVDRGFDFGTGEWANTCTTASVSYLYGARNSARTRWSKQLDLGATRHWEDSHDRRWELSFSLLNALFDPSGVFHPAAAGAHAGCGSPTPVRKGYELVLPAIPSVAIRVAF